MTLRKSIILNLRISLAALLLGLAAGSNAASEPGTQIEDAHRRYRLRVYERHRTDRATFDRQVAIGAQVVADWQSRGAPADEIPALIAWFDAIPGSAVYPRLSFAPPLDSTVPRPVSAPESAQSAPPAVPSVIATRKLPSSQRSGTSPTTTDLELHRSEGRPDASAVTRRAESPVSERPFEAPVGAPPAPTPLPTAPPEESPIDVDLLNAKVRHYNLTLSGIESELVRDGLWNAERLMPIAARLDRLMNWRIHLRIYYDAIQELQLRQSETLDDPSFVLSRFAQRMFEARIHHEKQMTRGTSPEGENWQEWLEMYSRQLQAWTEEAGIR